MTRKKTRKHQHKISKRIARRRKKKFDGKKPTTARQYFSMFPKDQETWDSVAHVRCQAWAFRLTKAEWAVRCHQDRPPSAGPHDFRKEGQERLCDSRLTPSQFGWRPLGCRSKVSSNRRRLSPAEVQRQKSHRRKRKTSFSTDEPSRIESTSICR